MMSNFDSIRSFFFEEPPDSEVYPEEQEFHNLVREYVIELLIVMTLYGLSYLLLQKYRLKREEQFFANEEDAFVYRISFWMCTFALAISIGSTLLLPFSIVSNEVLLSYPHSYYMQWLNDSLIQHLWNSVFLFSNISLFVLLPFAYFFTESEGFSGSSRGITSRVIETITLLLLLLLLILGITYLLCCTLGHPHAMHFTSLFMLWHYLPLLYSCVSFMGVILLLLCTPVGIATFFTVLGDLIVKPNFLRDIQLEYDQLMMEEMSLRREVERIELYLFELQTSARSPNASLLNRTYRSEQPPRERCESASCTPARNGVVTGNGGLRAPKVKRKFNSFPSFSLLNYDLFTRSSPPPSCSLNSSIVIGDTSTATAANMSTTTTSNAVTSPTSSAIFWLRKRTFLREANSSIESDRTQPQPNQSEYNLPELQNLRNRLQQVETQRKELESQKQASSLRRNLGYPLAILILFCLTSLTILLVAKNTLELLVGIKALPSSSAQRFTFGITSLSKLGPFGSGLEILLIFYLWITSLVGLYTLPLFNRLKPRKNGTSFTRLIANCVLYLVLSSALPVLARTIGITNFDLLGYFGQIEWLRSFHVVFFYNIGFITAITFTIVKKFTLPIRRELIKQLRSVVKCSLSSCKGSPLKSACIINSSSSSSLPSTPSVLSSSLNSCSSPSFSAAASGVKSMTQLNGINGGLNSSSNHSFTKRD